MKCTSFNSFTYVGNCSLKVNIALFMSHGFDIVSVPTKTFSAHMGYKGFVMSEEKDFETLIDSVEKIFPEVDLVQVGYLDDEKVFASIKKYLLNVEHKYLVVDPIHADDGEYYSAASKRQIEMYREIAKNADAITPNLTEAINIVDYDVPFDEITESDIIKIADRLMALGVKNVVIKSYVEDGEIKSYFKNEKESGFVSSPIVDAKFVGSGDAYASCVGIMIANGKLNLENLQTLQNIMYNAIKLQAPNGGYHDIKTDKIRLAF